MTLHYMFSTVVTVDELEVVSRSWKFIFNSFLFRFGHQIAAIGCTRKLAIFLNLNRNNINLSFQIHLFNILDKSPLQLLHIHGHGLCCYKIIFQKCFQQIVLIQRPLLAVHKFPADVVTQSYLSCFLFLTFP